MESEEGLKKTEWVHGNKMKMDSGHKEFDKQTDLITTGNAYTNTQTSSFVRGYLDDGKGLIDYPENKREPGHLQEFDLQTFKDVPDYVKNKVRKNAKGKDSVIFYHFFYYVGEQKVPLGYVITTGNHEIIDKIYARSGQKTINAVNEAAKYVAKDSDKIGFLCTEMSTPKYPELSFSSLPSTNPKGWHREPVNHSLAAKGIKVGKMRVKR